MRLFRKMIRWIDERWPLEALLRLSLEEEVPGGARYAYVFGSSVFVVFVLQVVSGAWQLLYFVPMIDRAYDSLNYLRIEVPFGRLIHGLHYWGASAMTILVGLHISQVFIWGAYQSPSRCFPEGRYLRSLGRSQTEADRLLDADAAPIGSADSF